MMEYQGDVAKTFGRRLSPEDPLKDLPKEPKDTVYRAYLEKTAHTVMSIEAQLPDETNRLMTARFEDADDAVAVFFGFMVACGFHPNSVTTAMREFAET